MTEQPGWPDEPEVLGGETAGEQETKPSNPFFVSKKAAAVLKHAILDQYLVPFASKVGKTALGGRVVYIDGYAGPGRYADGTPGSPALVIEQASRIADYRRLDCHFVERRKSDYERLRTVVSDAQAQGITCRAYRGSISRHLDGLLSTAGSAPLFVFLDPFGLGLPFEVMTRRVLGGNRGPTGYKTEVLLNFSANATRRIGGFLDPDCPARNREATLNSMDRVCGGTWWREVHAAYDCNDDRVEAIANEYATRLADAVGAGVWASPARNRATLQPVYHLVFLSRHPDGLWLFGDALARAQGIWRRFLDPPPVRDDGTLFDLQDTFGAEESRREEQWKGEIKQNIVSLLDSRGDFHISDHVEEVYGDALGLTTHRLLRKAVKELHKEGLTGCDGKGAVGDYYFTRPRP